jgi:light-regulated signal transduction histidine kinase (bacteriophytochrome)
MWFSEFLQEDYQGKLDDQADKYIRFITDGAQRMRSLITDLLSYSRLNIKAKPYEWVESQKAVDAACYNLSILIKETSTVVTCDEIMPRVYVDNDQFIQLLQNLISNSIKYCREQSPVIHIAGTERDTDWLFSVQDNGIGIKPEFYEMIFQMFQRLHTREEYSGTGIGLAICKKIVERHGGRIWVESEVGKGSTFYFTLVKPATEANHDTINTHHTN